MNVVGHDHPGVEMVTLGIEIPQAIHHDVPAV